MKKRIVLVLLSALLMFALAACGHRTSSEPNVSQDGTENTTFAAEPDIMDSQTEPSAPEKAASEPAASKTLVAYFSRTGENYGVGVIEKGNTEIIAEMIAEKIGADTFRIRTVNAYPESYDECTAVAKKERDRGARPELLSAVVNFDDYDVIYLGYPIWYGDMPMAVYTFLESYDFTGKTVIPFCTHAGSGLSGTAESIQNACPGASVDNGFAISGTTAQNDRENAEKQVSDWLDE